jgi:hypothetical protein
LQRFHEIPTCQAFATLGQTLQTNRLFAEDLNDQGLDILRLSRLKNMRKTMNVANMSSADEAPLRPLASKLLELQRAGWAATHCDESAWEYVILSYSQVHNNGCFNFFLCVMEVRAAQVLEPFLF